MKTTYEIDSAHSSTHFVVRHMMITNVRGSFSGVQGTIEYDPDLPNESRIDAVIDASGINTLDEQRDAHLKGPDFLHVEQHPTITFKSKKILPAGDRQWKITRDLTIHGVTNEVVLDADGDDLKIELEISAIKVQPAAAA